MTIWLLTLYLGISDPAGSEQTLAIDKYACLLAEAESDGGYLTRAQLNDGRVVLVVKAVCLGPETTAEVTQ